MFFYFYYYLFIDRLVALRLVFDNNDTYRRHFGQPSDLSRSLTELIREYGLHVELETEAAASCTTAVENNDETEKCSVASNILSAVRGTAQRLWNQKQSVFKGSECSNDSTLQEDAGKKKECSSTDAESGYAPSAESADAAVNNTQKPSCSVVTVVNETVQKSSAADGLQYRTLEYGASPADTDAQSSPECSIQCGTIINPLEAVQTVSSVTAVAPAPVVATENNRSTSDCCAAQAPVDREDTVVVTVVNDGEKNHTKRNVDNDESPSNKLAAANPPPPPPRKYYASFVPPVPTTVTVHPRVTATMTETTTLQQVTNHCTIAPEKSPLPSQPFENNEIPITVPDDYYWCTTTETAPSVLSTFGKQLSVGTADDGKETKDNISLVAGDGGAEKTVTCIGVVAAAEEPHVFDGGSPMSVTGGITTTVSIEDASLPSFSSDEDDEDDNGVFADKTASPCSVVTDNASDECNTTVGDGAAADKKNGDRNETVAKVAAMTSPGAAGTEPKSPVTKLPILRLQSTPPAAANNTAYFSSSSASSSSSSPSSPTNHGNNNNNSPIVSKIPVRRQSAGSGGGGTAVSSPLINGTGKKSIPLPLSRSGSRLAMWSSAN